MTSIVLDQFKGINNRARLEALPEGFLRDCVNTDVDGAGNLRNRPGQTLLYSGDVHSLTTINGVTYFIEGGVLKVLNDDNTATTIKTGLGNEAVYYTHVGDRIFYSNGVITGSIVNRSDQHWGVSRPDFQPTVTATTTGGMYAGEYQVVITFLTESGEESGCGQGVKVVLGDGGGIHVSNMPTAPSEVSFIAVYVTAVNSQEFYLYTTVPADTTELSIQYAVNTLPLRTQFSNRPTASQVIQAHYGQCFMAHGNLVRYTNSQNYGLVYKNNYWRFGGNVSLIVSLPNVLYIAADKTYSIRNINMEGMPIRTEVLAYGGVKGTLTYDTENEVAYWMSNRGKVRATSEGIQNITLDHVAMDKYTHGAGAVMEYDGLRKFICSCYGATDTVLDSVA